MEKLLVLVALCAVGIVVAKFRSDAARRRKEVMARLAIEREERGGADYSPTAELFREVGVRHDPTAPLPRSFADPGAPGPSSAAAAFPQPGVTTLADPWRDEGAVPPAPATLDAPIGGGLADLELPDPSGLPAPVGPPVSLAPPATAPVPAPETIAPAPETIASEAIAPETGPNDAAVSFEEPEAGDLPVEPVPQRRASDRPGASTTGDLRVLFRGISMPAGIRPLGALSPEQASFVTPAPATDVRAALEAEFDRLGCAFRWVEPTVAETARHGHRGLVTIHPHPSAVVDLDGTPRFAEAAPGEVVVHMRAL